ncbi:DUF6603 domain-containing protein [Mesorhizobium sp. WSM2561]|uniref:DUF6603 domain-containing protein n=1 Tax=Mesorhizobium sp. WSM2561 TaxID=1040985 RepID=UPI0004834C64|nr:DUF6603 domain-containing protein [Mesorhizobium sp. WSM2561]
MSSETGTLERLALMLADALTPLKDDLAAGNLDSLLRQLSLSLPAGFTVPPSLTAAAQTVATAAAALPAHVVALTAAIDAKTVTSIISEGAATLNQVRAVITAIDTLATQLPAALTGGGVSAAAANAFAGQFGDRLFSYAVVRLLERRHGVVLGAFGLAGVIDRMQMPNEGGAGTHLSRRLRFDRLGSMIGQPDTALRTAFGWGDPGFDGRDLLRRMADLLRALAVPVLFDETAASPVLELFAATIAPTAGPSPRGFAITLREEIPGGWSIAFDLTPRTRLDAALGGALSGGLAIEIRPPGTVSAHPSGTLQGRASIGITQHADPGDRLTLLGISGGIGVRAGSLGIFAATDLSWDSGSGQAHGEFGLGGDLKGGKLTIDFSQADGFIGAIVPAVKLDADLELGFDWSVDRGLRFRGSSALEIKLPTHFSLGPVAIDALTVGVGVNGNSFPISLSADIATRLGFLDVIVEEIGLRIDLSFPSDGHGDIGPLDMAFHFKPPKGAGLSVDTGIIKGGGYLRFDPDAGEYFGALELSFQGIIDIKAFGIINTKFPDGHSGFAFLILITAEFAPIQLSFGFTLLGVGGLLSLNRTLDTPALMVGVRTGAVNSILFPQDIVSNINRIATDIKAIFPLAEGHFIVAPMGKLGWGTPTLISLEIGVILDIPVPALVLIGVLRINIPAEDAPLLKLQVNFAGGIDFDRGLIWFNASLFDSRLVGFTLTGDMALRIGWGLGPMLVISVGGFHPAFREIPDDLRNMSRMTISLLSGNNPRLTVQTYFAITSNTVQNGSRVELYAEACGFNIYGFLGYDLLVQFNPVHFVASISAGIALREGDDVIAGISVHGELSGPAPWNANGKASLEILFFEISVRFNESWGADAPPDPVEIENVTGLVTAALNDDRNWKADAPANATAGVSVRKLEMPDGKIVLQPFGVLSVSQKVVPLAYPLQKFGNKKPDVDRFEVTTALAGVDEEREEFAVAQYKKLSDSDKLSARAFERMKSGLKFSSGDATETGTRVLVEVDYELSYVHRSIGITIFAGIYKMFGTVFTALAGGTNASKNAFSKVKNGGGVKPAAVKINGGEFLVVGVADLNPHAGMSAKTMAEAVAMQDALVASNPTLKGQVQVVAAHELDAAA